jgi:outer membrane protein assembly factor BamB
MNMRMLFMSLALAALCAGCGKQTSPPPPAAEPPLAGKSIADLVAALGSEDTAAKMAAADELRRRGPAATEAVRPLLKAMTGKSAWVDFAMMHALAAMGESGLQILAKVFEDPKDELRFAAGRAIWTFGAAAKSALPVIQKVADDKTDLKISDLAKRILDKIDDELKAVTTTADAAAGPGGADMIRVSVPAGTSKDWPQFHGPNRDSICAETGLLAPWPEGGPTLLWKLEGIGRGFSMPAIAGGRLYVTGDRNGADGKPAQFCIAHDLATRRELWAARIGGAYPDYGALGTPTVDGERTFVMSTDGDLLCLDTAGGSVRWQKSMTKDFGAPSRNWRFSESPLVDGDKVICTPGGTNVVLAALDKRNGDVLWRCSPPDIGPKGKDGAGYSSPVVADIGGARQYVQVTGRGVVGVAADTGRFLWSYNRVANNIANITAPVVRGDRVFVANSYSTGAALLRIRRDGDAFKAEEVSFLAYRDFENHHGGIVLVGDYIFGGSGLGKGDPACIHFPTGRLMWKQRAPVTGSAAVLYADGHLVFRYDRGPVYLVEASPKEFRIKGHFTPLTADGPAWSHPVIHDRKLYLRHNNLLACYDLGR